VVTTAGLAVALLGGALLLVGALHASLVRGLDNTARQGAQEVAALANKNDLPRVVPVAAGTITVQVLNAGGRIEDASPGADRLVPLLPAPQARADARSRRAVLLDGRPYGLPYLLRVVSVPANRGRTVIAAVDFQQVRGSVEALARALVVGTPLLLILLAWVTWVVVGSTLRPISALRRGAQEVRATAQPRALPVPEARDEVHSLAVTLNDMLDRLAEAQARQRGLISDTAHELRSPIASIRAQLEVALDHPDAQDWRETASGALADTLRLGKLVEDLLLLARLDERGSGGGRNGRDGQDGPGGPVDLAALAAEEAGRAAGGRVPVRGPAPAAASRPCLVSGDRESLRRLLVNLIGNAVRYARSGVDVAVTCAGTDVVLSVTDDGPGIPEHDRERVFGRFVRLDDARSRDGDGPEGTEGAGLGLAIVRATAQAHGGRAWLEEASPGTGLCAKVALPAAAPRTAAGTPGDATSAPTAAAR
jgi:signal transduction histidine kinase